MAVYDDTIQAVDGHWRTAREIHDRVGCWAFTSVHHALQTMSEANMIDAKYAPHRNGTVVRYKTHSTDG